MPEHRRTDHEAALVAAAAAGDLGPEERRAYDALALADPSVAAETLELRGVLDRVGALPGWTEQTPDDDLTARVLGVPGQATPRNGTGAGAGRWRRLPAAAAAVVLLVVGGVTGAVVDDLVVGGDGEGGGDRDTAAEGSPGTLGAVEAIAFTGEPSGVAIDASVIAHTWGTETVLDMDGWETGEDYRLVLVGTDGETAESGTFRGSEVTIVDCRLNAALLRAEVDAVEIRDAGGRVVARSDLPEVTGG